MPRYDLLLLLNITAFALTMGQLGLPLIIAKFDQTMVGDKFESMLKKVVIGLVATIFVGTIAFFNIWDVHMTQDLIIQQVVALIVETTVFPVILLVPENAIFHPVHFWTSILNGDYAFDGT